MDSKITPTAAISPSHKGPLPLVVMQAIAPLSICCCLEPWYLCGWALLIRASLLQFVATLANSRGVDFVVSNFFSLSARIYFRGAAPVWHGVRGACVEVATPCFAALSVLTLSKLDTLPSDPSEEDECQCAAASQLQMCRRSNTLEDLAHLSWQFTDNIQQGFKKPSKTRNSESHLNWRLLAKNQLPQRWENV